MDKISSILKTSPRVQSVDPKSITPGRPGAPGMGRPQGRISSQDRFSVSDVAKEKAFQETLAIRNPREDRHSKIAEQTTREFFETRFRPDEALVEAPIVDEPVFAPDEDYASRGSLPVRGSQLDTQG